MNDVIKIIKSLEDSDELTDGVTKTVKHEIKKQEGQFLGAFLPPLAASIVQSVISRYKWKRSYQEEDIWIKIFSSTPSFKQYRDY